MQRSEVKILILFWYRIEELTDKCDVGKRVRNYRMVGTALSWRESRAIDRCVMGHVRCCCVQGGAKSKRACMLE
jgi:hypothetical protein